MSVHVKRSLLWVSHAPLAPGQPKQTGGTISNNFLLENLAETCSVTLLTFVKNPLFKSYAKSMGVEVVEAPCQIASGFDMFLHWNKHVKCAARQLINDRGAPNLLMVTTTTFPAAEVSVGDNGNTKKIAIIQAYENFGFKTPLLDWRIRIGIAKRSLIMRFSDSRNLRRCNGIITNSQYMKNSISQRFKINQEIIHIVPQFCDISASVVQFKEVCRKIGFVSRGDYKNLPFVVNLARYCPEFEFYLYGHIDQLPPGSPSNMVVKGWEVSRKKMYDSAGIWIMPSSWPEPFGRVSIEAQAANRVSLVIDKGGLPETVLWDYQVVSSFDLASWRAAILRVTDLTNLETQEIGQFIRSKFSREKHDDAIKKNLGKIMND